MGVLKTSRPVAPRAAGLPALSSAQATLLLSVGMVLFCNIPFWVELLRLRDLSSLRDLGFIGSIGLVLILALNLFLTLTAFRVVQKIVAVLLLTTSALASYFVSSYGVLIDRTMMQNVIESDPGEVSELLTFRLVAHLVVFGALPALGFCLVRIRYRSLLRDLGLKVGVVGFSLVGLGLCVGPFYPDYASFFPQNRHLGHLVTPLNYLYGTGRVVAGTVGAGSSPVRSLGLDASLVEPVSSGGKKTILILVVGETARAEQFSLNGYARRTNPALSQEPVVSFDNVSACGTSTAVALPCMFSYLRRDNYEGSVARRQEGLLDVLTHAGVHVLWRDNNSGCKGTCDRVQFERSAEFGTSDHCDSGECLDESLLDGLDSYLASIESHAVIVLHQKGSHGPAYYRRTPARFKRFTPECRTSQLPDCDPAEIVNAYDNTILYTDYILSEVIRLLRRHEGRFNTAMLYLSDHGESLGDRNIYLHGLPYAIAPEEQTRVPLIAWLSPELEQVSGVDSACLAATRDRSLSHDHLFHSVLGLMNVETGLYERGLDLFAPCRRNGMETAEHDPPSGSPAHPIPPS